MTKYLSAAIMAGAVMSGTATAAHAGTTTGNLSVTATVVATCAVTSTTAVAFPAYTPGSGAVSTTGAVNLKCTNGDAITVSLGKGLGTGATVAARLMTINAGTATLAYNLYTNSPTSNPQTPFGDGTLGTSTSAATGAGPNTLVTVNVYGTIPDSGANLSATPGSYADTVVATVTY